MADPDQGQELQHQPVGRRRSCALALVAADAGPLPAKGVGSREAQPAHEVRQENFEEDDHIATESRAAWDLYVYFTCYIYMQEGTRKRRKRRGEERREVTAKKILKVTDPPYQRANLHHIPHTHTTHTASPHHHPPSLSTKYRH